MLNSERFREKFFIEVNDANRGAYESGGWAAKPIGGESGKEEEGQEEEEEEVEEEEEEGEEGEEGKEEKEGNDFDVDEWVGYVDWVEGDDFAAPGDSGSLVFALEDNTIIPLGIHIGSSNNKSYFVNLETCCYGGGSMGFDFCLIIDSFFRTCWRRRWNKVEAKYEMVLELVVVGGIATTILPFVSPPFGIDHIFLSF